MGRPSLADERKQQILNALFASIREEGYEATTLGSVAARAGVQRTLIRHYFGNRDGLLAAAVEHLTEGYRADYVALSHRLPARGRLGVLLDYLFGGAFNRRPDDDAVIDALIGVSRQSRSARASLRRMYEAFEEVCSDAVVSAFPRVSRARARQVAYGIMCLAESNALLLCLGFDASRSADARAAADALLASLTPRHRRSRKESR
jgi:AcrR family transcriptional regulator